MRKFLCVFVFSHGASQQRPCVRIGLTHAYLSHVKMTLANPKSVNRQTLENVVRNAASEFTRRTAIASLASLRKEVLKKGGPLLECNFTVRRPLIGFCLGIAKSSLSVTKCRQASLSARVGVACRLSLCDTLQEEKPPPWRGRLILVL